MLSEYCDSSRIAMNLAVKEFTQAIARMVEMSTERNRPSLVEEIMKRELLMSTALGKGIALPRITIAHKERSEIVIALSPQGINYSSIDMLPVKVIFLFLFSSKDDSATLIAQSLWLLNGDSFRTELLNSQTAEDVMRIMKEREEK